MVDGAAAATLQSRGSKSTCYGDPDGMKEGKQSLIVFDSVFDSAAGQPKTACLHTHCMRKVTPICLSQRCFTILLVEARFIPNRWRIEPILVATIPVISLCQVLCQAFYVSCPSTFTRTCGAGTVMMPI